MLYILVDDDLRKGIVKSLNGCAQRACPFGAVDPSLFTRAGTTNSRSYSNSVSAKSTNTTGSGGTAVSKNSMGKVTRV